MVAALNKAGIDADPGLFESIDQMPGFFMSRYKDRPEFQEEHFRAQGAFSAGEDLNDQTPER
jgi:hypothetical protein